MASHQRAVAFVTGASSGIGAEFCRQLADECDLILATGRNIRRLRKLVEEIGSRSEVSIFTADLTSPGGLAKAMNLLQQIGQLKYLVNSAGFGNYGKFASTELDKQIEVLALNANAMMTLCHLAIGLMMPRKTGYIINVSSLVAFQPSSHLAVYGASKSFMNHFSHALQAEVADSGIVVQALCPGATRTEFHKQPTFKDYNRDEVEEHMWMSAEQLVRESLAALNSGNVICIPGENNKSYVESIMRTPS